MSHRNTSVRRIHNDLDKKLNEISSKNAMDRVKASREIAKALDKMKGKTLKRRQIIEEIKF